MPRVPGHSMVGHPMSAEEASGEFDTMDEDGAFSLPLVDISLPFPLPLVDHSLPLVDNSLPFLDHSLPSVDHSLPLVDHSLPLVDISLPFLDHSLPSVEFSLPFVDISLPFLDISNRSLTCQAGDSCSLTSSVCESKKRLLRGNARLPPRSLVIPF